MFRRINPFRIDIFVLQSMHVKVKFPERYAELQQDLAVAGAASVPVLAVSQLRAHTRWAGHRARGAAETHR